MEENKNKGMRNLAIGMAFSSVIFMTIFFAYMEYQTKKMT
jgi:hypothetical protein